MNTTRDMNLLPGEILPGVRPTPRGFTLRDDTPDEAAARLDQRTADDLLDNIDQIERHLPAVEHGPTREMMVRSIEMLRAALDRKGE